MIEKFLKVMSPNSPVIFREFNTSWGVYTISKSVAMNSKDSNIYFLWGVKENAKRLTDLDIGEIHYIRLDIDIRKWVKLHLWAEADEGDILWFINEIKDKLDWNKLLKDRSYIIFSWWGCHIYYSSLRGILITDSFTPKLWQLAMKRIYSLYDSVIEEEYLLSDRAVCNTARVMRLPGSINQKNWAECRIIHSEPDRQSPLFPMIEELGRDAFKNLNKYADKRNAEVAEMKAKLLASGWKDTDIKYEIINRIPSYLISQILLPSFVFDGKKNFKHNGKMKWFFYVNETNSICNWGSEEYAWKETDSCWNNYSLVERYLSLTKEQTFKWFEDKFTL